MHKHWCPVCSKKWEHKKCAATDKFVLHCDKCWTNVLRERKVNKVPEGV